MLSPAPGDGLAVRGTVGGTLRMSLRARHGTSRRALAAILGIGLLLPAYAGVAAAESAVTPDTIKVEGNRRVEAETVRSYFAAHAGAPLDAAAIDTGLKAAYASGLFRDVQIKQTADGLIVTVAEAPVIDHIQFEGNKSLKDKQLTDEVHSKARGTLLAATVQGDVARLVETYKHSGRFDVKIVPKTITHAGDRVDLVFEITEGEKTTIRRIDFVGNRAFATRKLKDAIKTGQTNVLSFLTGSDLYDPDRIEADRDLLRRFYLNRGYVDARIVSADAKVDPALKGIVLTFTLEEGEPYRFGAVDVRSSVAQIDGHSLSGALKVRSGDVYNDALVDKSVDDLTVTLAKRGLPFGVARARSERNPQAHTVDLVFAIEEGARTYVERINIRGNGKTRDYVIRREFDISEGDAYNRALVDRAERRLKNLDYFKSVKITTEPGSSSDRVVLIVDLEEKSTGDFSISGGYSTTDGALAEVSVSERNLLGRGLFAKASVTYGQYARGYSLSFVEPYLLDYRVALGLDFYQRTQLSNSYISYGTKTLGFSPRLGFSLREDLALQLRYSVYQQEITLPYYLANCNNIPASGAFNPSPAYAALNGIDLSSTTGLGCYSDGEASLPVRKELANGKTLTSALGYSLSYNTLDNNKNPTDGLIVDFKQDFAGVGGDVTYLKTVADAKYYQSLVSDLVGLVHLQGGVLTKMGSDLRMLDHFQMGPNLVRGFAPNGIGPRDLNPYGTQDALGGTKYWGASLELQMPFWFLPKEVGLKGAVYADAGGLYDYQGPTTWALTGETTTTKNSSCTASTINPATPGTCTGLVYDDSKVIRSSVGVGLIWASPFGPLRFDYAVPLTKGKNDRTQEFRFGGGTSF
jgi:outer membrane protein insertion porin family